MTAIDWPIIVFTVLLAVYGYAQGFIVGALSLAGFAVGAFLGTRLAPLLLPGGAHSVYAPVFGLLGALLAGGMLASGLEGLGLRARSALRVPGLRTVDGVLGGFLTAAVGLGVAWIIGAVALDASGSLALRHDIQRSAILSALNTVLPPTGPILDALARFDPLPTVPGPLAQVPPPPRGIGRSPGIAADAASVVRITGTACGLGIEGSGWVTAPGLIATNAHVVAGESDTTVQPFGRGNGLSATPVWFDPHNDIAILRVPGLAARPLSMAQAAPSGTPGAILGYPLDGPYNVQPARVGHTGPVQTEDAYGRGPVTRLITSLRGLVRPGNSGGPVVDAAGEVLATVFAAVTDGGRGAGGFAVPDGLVRAALDYVRARGGAPVGTGACAG